MYITVPAALIAVADVPVAIAQFVFVPEQVSGSFETLIWNDPTGLPVYQACTEY